MALASSSRYPRHTASSATPSRGGAMMPGATRSSSRGTGKCACMHACMHGGLRGAAAGLPVSVQVSAAACMHGGASDAYRCRCMHSVTMYMQGAWMHGGQLRGFQCESTPCFPVQQATPTEPRSCLCKLSLEASTCYTCGSSGSTPHAPFTLSCSPSRTGRSAPTRVAPRSTTSTRSRRRRGTCSKM